MIFWIAREIDVCLWISKRNSREAGTSAANRLTEEGKPIQNHTDDISDKEDTVSALQLVATEAWWSGSIHVDTVGGGGSVSAHKLCYL